jgi:predicted  nucleic acid-binding Zn ribbon protein
LEASNIQNNDLFKHFKQNSNSEVKLNEASLEESQHKEISIKDSQVLDKKEGEMIDTEVLFPTQLRSYYASAEF